MSKVKLYNLTKQLINLNVLDLEGDKEIMVPLVGKGCVAIDSIQETKDIAIKRKKGMIKLERAPEPVKEVHKPEPVKSESVKHIEESKDRKKIKKDKPEK